MASMHKLLPPNTEAGPAAGVPGQSAAWSLMTVCCLHWLQSWVVCPVWAPDISAAETIWKALLELKGPVAWALSIL